ncbi:DUF1127 domain-containing protein [Sneathiella glossodoripedis]|uniref:DUF1127 domain-containing protein n=1 Tax=Sneathiella glossodoripedis TaxID=418853 RepID=UPI00046F105A|nr:DUF1127 domain-containing protein [Sneathiella glossodoripedis]
MISFTEKDLDDLAMFAPAVSKAGTPKLIANNNGINMDRIIADAHRARSEQAHRMVADIVSSLKARIAEYRKTQTAIAQLQAMSDRELSDLRVTRSNIVHAVKGDKAAKTSKIKPVLAWIGRMGEKVAEWRMRREGYHQLMAMDARQLSDIGLTRGDIANVMSGKSALANDNVRAANTNKDVKAS